MNAACFLHVRQVSTSHPEQVITLLSGLTAGKYILAMEIELTLDTYT